ncbi:MAG: AbrB/MazE/SpoVT family DNA-binding domain-containing protein [Thermoproteota archaeon]|jgi:AbrB family looped-hinge helix DNA binding protein|nr:AbrB/MazE/SpoVT family DNA-binding domain-containing protein [Thermoproteota archaeon]
MEKIVRFGKRNTIHLPKAIVEEIGIKEGDMLVLVYDKEKIELRPLKFQRKYWAEISFKEIEEVGEEISRSLKICG